MEGGGVEGAAKRVLRAEAVGARGEMRRDERVTGAGDGAGGDRWRGQRQEAGGVGGGGGRGAVGDDHLGDAAVAKRAGGAAAVREGGAADPLRLDAVEIERDGTGGAEEGEGGGLAGAGGHQGEWRARRSRGRP